MNSTNIVYLEQNKQIYTKCLERRYSHFLSKIISSRISSEEELKKVLDSQLKNLDSPFLLKDIDIAVERLILAIQNNEIVGLETDHDCDGQTSHAVLYEALVKIFGVNPDNIRSYIGHRLKEGYGLSELLMNRILNDDKVPSLVITADNGSSDEKRIKTLKENGIDVIVTDHHAIPLDGVPKSAYVVINPTQNGCDYPDKYIAGCMVAWLFIAATHSRMLKQKIQVSKQINITDLLDFVAIGTVADCVSMAKSKNNRIVAMYGLAIINKFLRPCWQVIKNESGVKTFYSEDVAFNIAPILNSDGRISDALRSLYFLLAKDKETVKKIFSKLKKQNIERKDIQRSITNIAMAKAYKLVLKNKKSLCIMLDNGHVGVHGISASRIKDRFGRVCIIFSTTQKDENIISGSARSIDEINLKKCLDIVAVKKTNLFIKYGGHKGAAGLTLYKKDFEVFYTLFEELVSDFYTKQNISLTPNIYIDTALNIEDISLENCDQLHSLEPYGREFDRPIFSLDATLQNFRFVGMDKKHAQIFCVKNGKSIKGIWFNAKDYCDNDSFQLQDSVRVCFELKKEEFCGNISVVMQVKYMQKL